MSDERLDEWQHASTAGPRGRHARIPFDFGEAFRGQVRHDEPMAKHTTYRIGGPARWFITVESLDALSKSMRECARLGVPWTVVGQGSNASLVVAVESAADEEEQGRHGDEEVASEEG